MAFRQPSLQPTVRPLSAPAPEQQQASLSRISQPQTLDDSREWILFPKATSTADAPTASTERTPRTAGLSRLSDFGSLNTVARSREENAVHCEATLGSDTADDELDSLDEGLHAFQEPGSQDRSGYFDQSFPRHDGLGTFPASSPNVQDQIWHFERYNPRKRSFPGHQRRRSSVQRKLDAVELDDAAKVEEEKRDRIEKWRLDHSRILLDEIEKETRRRQSVAKSPAVERNEDTASAGQSTPKTVEAQQSPAQPRNDESESFLQKITRKVIRDFIGIDEATLSVILGETLPTDTADPPSGRSIALPTSPPSPAESLPWETRLLNRLGRELGILLDQLTEHPGAFSSSTVFNFSNPDYAGIPITEPTSSRTHPRRRSLNLSSGQPISPSFDFSASPKPPNPSATSSTAAAAAAADSRHASLWGIDEEPNSHSDQEYWSQRPTLRTAFRLLHTHFTTSRRPASPSTPLNIATTSTPDSLRRAAVIRQHHPLVSRATINQWEQRHGHSGRRGSFHFSRGYAGTGGSCGSQSLRRGKRATATTTTTTTESLESSSRNFWDLGGSATGSLGGGWGGAWGEV